MGLACQGYKQKAASQLSTLDFNTAEMSRTSYICVQLKSAPATNTSCLLLQSQATGEEWGTCYFSAALACLCFLPLPHEAEMEQNSRRHM